MDKSSLVAAVAKTSALSTADATNAVEFVFHVLNVERRGADLETPGLVNSSAHASPQPTLFAE